MEVNVHEAKTNFSKLLQRVFWATRSLLPRQGCPSAKLVRYVTKKGKRPLGFLKGEIWMADDFDAPLPPDSLLSRWLPWGRRTRESSPSKKAQASKKAQEGMKYYWKTRLFLECGRSRKAEHHAREILEDRSAELFAPPVVSWEIIITQTGHLIATSRYQRISQQTWTWHSPNSTVQAQPITHAHTLMLGELPPIPHDPFDRMLVAQARSEKLILMTSDSVIEKYPVETLWCEKNN